MRKVLDVYSDLSEKLNYNLPDFPLYVRKGALRQFERYAAECHWHVDLEFLLVLEGSLDYFVNGRTVHIDAGHAIFVNSRRLHYGFSKRLADCTFIVVVVHPSLLGDSAPAGKRFFHDKFGTETDDLLLLDLQEAWHHDAIALMQRLYVDIHAAEPSFLRLLATAAALCAEVGEHVQPAARHQVEDQSWMIVRRMTGHIHQHYGDRLRLDEIAAAGAVSRSRCCKLFGQCVGQTPNDYLTRYRIQKACEMLRDTRRSIGEIADACGFQTASYFAFSFRREIDTTPQEYRRRHAAQSPAPGTAAV